jgi:hypothetical protein
VENAEDTEAAKYAVNLGNMLGYLAPDRYLDAAEAYIANLSANEITSDRPQLNLDISRFVRLR